MRRVHLRRHRNILKHLLVHVAGYNMNLLMCHAFCAGKPKARQDASANLLGALFGLKVFLHAIAAIYVIAEAAIFGGVMVPKAYCNPTGHYLSNVFKAPIFN